MVKEKQNISELINQFDYSGWRRIGIHLFFWSIVYMFIRFETNQNNYYSDQTLFELIVLRDFLICVFSHYFIIVFIIPKLLNARWIPSLLLLILAYIIVHTMSYWSNQLLLFYFENAGMKKALGKYYFKVPFIIGMFSPITVYYNYAVYGFNTAITIVVKVSKDIFQSRIRNTALEKENLKLEMDFLKAQVNPHFLFNTLNNVYSLIIDKDEAAANILIKLSDLMRYTLYETNTDKILLSRELKFIEDYIALEKIRHQRKVKIELNQKGNTGNLMIPPLILITFVENAFKHGVNNTIEASWIKITIEVENNTLKFDVLNSKPKKLREETMQGGIGVVNVQKRLKNLYPQNHSLSIKNQADTFHIHLILQLNG